ncbi:MAG: hypothetical protein K2O69_02385 [Odoribacter sp.]|nr:hypothetical protein [Odoribacter sp.]
MGFKVVYSFALIGILLSIESCYFFRRSSFDTNVAYSWLIINQQEQEVIFKVYSQSDVEVKNMKQDSVWLMRRQIMSETIEPFEFLNATIDSIGVYSIDDKVLKMWYPSERFEEGIQFFKEESWKKEECGERNYLCYEWTFELLPEDIQQ